MKIKRKRVQLSFEGQTSRTKQAFQSECDINNILKKYHKTQTLTHTNSLKGSYGDFSNVHDYHAATQAVMDAHDRFNGLPSSIRSKFMNDPSKLIEFISNDSNYEEAIKLGLIETEKAQAYLDSKNPPKLPS